MDGLMGNGWADAWMGLVTHFGLQRSHVYPSLTIPWFKHIFARGGYPLLRELTQRFLRNRTLSGRHTVCSVLNWETWGSWGRWCARRVSQRQCNFNESWKGHQVQKRRYRQSGGSAWTQQSPETSGQKVKRRQDSLLLGQEHGREEWRGWGWKMRQEPKVDPPVCICQLFHCGNLVSLSYKF